MSWTGDPKTVGSGSQEIVESRPPELLKVKLDFGDHGVAMAQFTLAPEGSGTKVVWSIDCDMGMNPAGRYFGLMFDGMIGPDYEKGLAGLKKISEALPKADFAGLKVETIEVPAATLA